MWAPSDNNAISRCLTSFLKLVDAQPRPKKLIWILPLPLTTGMNSVSNILDLWSSPLTSENWVPIVKDVAFVTHPFDIISTSPVAPRHEPIGLA